jgi:hypothetical protein
MKITILILSLIGLTFGDLNAQCEELIQRFEFPLQYSMQSPLTPDPCDAKSNYGTIGELVYSPVSGYQEVKKRVRVVSETSWDADNCKAETTVLSRDTVVISNQRFGQRPGRTTGGYWTIRMELLIQPPGSRPDGSMCTKLPKGSLTQKYKDGSTREIKDYWVVHYGQYFNEFDCKDAVKEFKAQYPEFCRAYAYFLPGECEYQYQYKNQTQQ